MSTTVGRAVERLSCRGPEPPVVSKQMTLSDRDTPNTPRTILGECHFNLVDW